MQHHRFLDELSLEQAEALVDRFVERFPFDWKPGHSDVSGSATQLYYQDAQQYGARQDEWCEQQARQIVEQRKPFDPTHFAG